jgi:hypothetical protein
MNMETVKKQVKDLKPGDQVILTVRRNDGYHGINRSIGFYGNGDGLLMVENSGVDVVKNTKIEVGCKAITDTQSPRYTVSAIDGIDAWVEVAGCHYTVPLGRLTRVD